MGGGRLGHHGGINRVMLIVQVGLLLNASDKVFVELGLLVCQLGFVLLFQDFLSQAIDIVLNLKILSCAQNILLLPLAGHSLLKGLLKVTRIENRLGWQVRIALLSHVQSRVLCIHG